MKYSAKNLFWAYHELPAALHALAVHEKIEPSQTPETHPPMRTELLNDWMVHQASAMGLTAQLLSIRADEQKRFLTHVAPAVIVYDAEGGEKCVLVLIGSGASHVRVLGSDEKIHSISIEYAEQIVTFREKKQPIDPLESVLSACGVPTSRIKKLPAFRGMHSQLISDNMYMCWLVSVPPSWPLYKLLGRSGVWSRLASTLALEASVACAWTLGWFVIGQSALSGHFSYGSLGGWALALSIWWFVRFMSALNQNEMALLFSARIKQKFLWLAMRSNADAVRRMGVGKLIGQIMEADAVEDLSLEGIGTLLTGLVELGVCFIIFQLGFLPTVQSVFTLFWMLVCVVLTWSYAQAFVRWSDARIDMSQRLVENFVGHRTRLVQLPAAQWNEHEETNMLHYAQRARLKDRWESILSLMAAKGYLVLSLVLVGFGIFGSIHAPEGLAISLAGLVLGYNAFSKLASSFQTACAAFASYRQHLKLSIEVHDADTQNVNTQDANLRHGSHGALHSLHQVIDLQDKTRNSNRTSIYIEETERFPLLELRNVTYMHRARPTPTFEDLSFQIYRGDRILLTGPSGTGKSTLASIMAGLRNPTDGLVLLDGLDRHAWGSAQWRKRITLTPQFFENHVFSASFAFNALMGRGWPPDAKDYRDLLELCEAFQLGSLLERMPAGLEQMVGDTGWQLSSGERSRLFLCRSLLTQPDLLIVDESLGTLDPETRNACLDVIMQKAKTVILIAHR